MDPRVLHPVLGPWDPWVHPLPLDGHQSGPMGAPGHGMDSSVDPLVLHPVLSSWDPWVHPLPLEGHSMDPLVLHPVLSLWDP